ncbi:class C sortase [Jeotgalibaca sp. MA1X17-3]|uniref:class C sortase n=1 Tax=Jeotgalibaca sp. MA1X17-3 TaxID=2908211 RepID=UPI001F35C11D|nr:class C sortase [Jeotgalibaca sp. MA1X17-3]UJF16300.1 class C sortase [Jeotgalibaca sp. MA1X17-3]
MKKNKKKSSHKISVILMGLGIVLGLAFVLYPFFSQLYYDYSFNSEVDNFQQELKAIDPPELKKENVKKAEAYNEALEPNLRWIDPYSEKEREEGVEIYAEMLQVREKIGVLNFSKLNLILPIYAGTNENILQKGVGHLEGTSLPVGGKNTHSVLTAHRGLPEARLFTDLDQVEIGDIFSAETMAGELFYEVDQIQVVEPTQTDTVKIVEGEDYLTLLTCTPYMINSHRLLVRGKRIPTPPKEVVEKIKVEQEKDFMYYLNMYGHYFLIIIITFLLVFVVLVLQKKKMGKSSI